MRQHEQHARLQCTGRAAPPVLERVRIHARAIAPLLEVAAEQHYVNRSCEDLEVVYTFPVPPRAVLLGLEFVLGDRTLTGTVKAKHEADKEYEEAVQGGDSAVLVEAQRDGLYTANLGNLKAGERACIRLRYGQLLEAQGDDWRIAIPTVLAPFYGDAERDGRIQRRAAPWHSLAVEYPLELTLALPLPSDESALRCTSHEAVVEVAGTGIVARLADGARLDRDVVFLARRGQQATALAGSDGDRAVVVASSVLGRDDVAEAPVSVRIVLDCSGSMAGDSMDWAAVGCQQLVKELRDDDEFSITRFGTNVDHWMRHLARATSRNRAEYARRLLNVVADLGGTEMEQALRTAAALRSRQERSEVVLLTDGEIWASDALVRWARGTGLRVFVIGIGTSPNQPFLRRLAEETGGSCDFVSPGEDMIRAVQRVMARLRQPRREALTVAWPVQPDWMLQLPAVAHAGQTVHLIAGFEAAPIGEAIVGGRPVALPGHTTEDATLSRVVAYQRLLSGHFAEPVAAAEQYQLVTEWTSLIAVLERADGEKAIGLPQIAQVEHMVPAGWGGNGTVRHSLTLASRSLRIDSLVSAFDSPAIWRSRDVSFECRVAGGDDLGEPPVDLPEDTPSPEELLALKRSEAARKNSDEVSAWVRAINRRLLVESLSAEPSVPTLEWLGGCISRGALKCLEEEVRNGADEVATVLAFIALLESLSPSLDEGLSEKTKRWLHERGVLSANPGDTLPASPAQRALDAVLLQDEASSARRSSPASAPA